MTQGMKVRSRMGEGDFACTMAVALALAAITFAGSILNVHVYSVVATFFGPAREISACVGAATLAAIGVVSRIRPSFLNWPLLCALSAALLLFQAILCSLSVYRESIVLTTCALCCGSVAQGWVISLLALCLTRLSSKRHAAIAVVFGMFAGQAMGSISWVSHSVAIPAFSVSALLLTAMALCAAFSRSGVDTLQLCEPASVLEITNPYSFLDASHGFFQCVLLFSCAGGFALAFNEVGNAPLAKNVIALALVAIVLYAVLVCGDKQEDMLFAFSTMLVMAGFLLVPYSMGGLSSASNTLIELGESCFSVLIYLMVFAVGNKNLFATLPVFCFAECANKIGIVAGAIVGHASNAASLGSAALTEVFAAVFVFAFFSFLWVRFRTFSFSDIISSIECVEPENVVHVGHCVAVESDEQGAHPAESIEECCERVGEAHGLTPREREIFAMLAKGRNGRFIMEHYVISRNTVKSHIKHIYAKLDVHSQQELIDMVEGELSR